MLVKFPVWEYHNTQLGFSLQLNSNTKKDFRFLRIKSPFLYSWSYYFTAPFCFAFIWFRVQGSGLSWRLCRLFLLGDARKWYSSHQSLVTPTIRGKESSHMCGMRSFGSVPICSGCGSSHIGRFRPLRMTIRGSGWAFIWEICCVFWNYRCYIRYE